MLAYSPLAQGLLTGKYQRVEDCPPGLSRSRFFDKSRSPSSRHGEDGCEKELFAALRGLEKIAARLGMTMSQLSLAWLRQKGPASIVGKKKGVER